jgi:3-methyl-2-oxobutanoate hydroxymethyltransferase
MPQPPTTNTTPARWTALRIRALKGQAPFACLTAWDAISAAAVDACGLPLILVGDSLGMTVLGHPNTLPVTMADMLHHVRAVARTVRHGLVVADMPFLSYHLSPAQALENAGRFIQEAGADAVKIEGGAFRAPTVRFLTQNGVPVLGHIGLTPQSLKMLGGYKVQGRKPRELRNLLADARALEKAGAFALVLECLPPAVGRAVTRAVSIPTIGCGAGPHCDGQILVTADLLGLLPVQPPRFAKRYADLGSAMRRAIASYQQDVQAQRFPGPENCYT